MDRSQAEEHVQRTGEPVLRHSSQAPYFAITYKLGIRINHSLLRQNNDGTVDMLRHDGSLFQHYNDWIRELLYDIYPDAQDTEPRADPIVG
jgi:hypothetical protein